MATATLKRLSYRETILGWKLGRGSWVSGEAISKLGEAIRQRRFREKQIAGSLLWELRVSWEIGQSIDERREFADCIEVGLRVS